MKNWGRGEELFSLLLLKWDIKTNPKGILQWMLGILALPCQRKRPITYASVVVAAAAVAVN